MTELKIGDKSPSFSGNNQNGEAISYKQYEGKKLVIFFYPKDNTPGCTKEVCNLRDNYEQFQSQGYELLGVSPDSEKSHTNFIKKFDLPFDLLADTEKETAKAFGAWGEKQMYGKTYMGILRSTFVINEKGLIEDIIRKVKTADHSQQILKS